MPIEFGRGNVSRLDGGSMSIKQEADDEGNDGDR